jgi:hypothetical protein
MSSIAVADARTRAAALVERILAERTEKSGAPDTSTAAETASLVDAIEADLIAADQKATTDAQETAERLLQVEVQTRLLAEAVIAIADPGVTVAPAIKALKAEM